MTHCRGYDQARGLFEVADVRSCFRKLHRQDSPAVLPIINDVVNQLKSERPEIKQIFFGQDNAGCYQSRSGIEGVRVMLRDTPSVPTLEPLKLEGVSFVNARHFILGEWNESVARIQQLARESF